MEAFDRDNQDRTPELIMISVVPLSAETVRWCKHIKNMPDSETDVCEANINRLFALRPQARRLFFFLFFQNNEEAESRTSRHDWLRASGA